MSVGRFKAYRGYQTWRSNVLMSMWMYIKVFLAFFIVQVVLMAFYISQKFGLRNLLSYVYEYVTLLITENITHLLGGGAFNSWSVALNTRMYLESIFLDLWHEVYYFFPFSLLIYLAYPVIIVRFARRARKDSATIHLRGPQLKSPEEVQKAIDDDSEKTDLNIGYIKMPISKECQHTYIIGTTGTGKTTFLRQGLDKIRARDECAIIYDLKGDFVSTYYDPSRDFIFNPLDSRCLGWNVFNDIKKVPDIYSFAASLIPTGVGDAVHWNSVARDIFIGVMHFLCAEGKTTNSDLWNALSSSSREIRDMLASTEGGKAGLKHLEDPSSKQAGSAISTLMNFVSVFRFMSSIDGEFSFYNWVRKRRGWIFVVNTPEVQEMLRPILSLAVDIVAKNLMSLVDDRNRRIFMVIDELGTLHQLDGLINIITLGRSKGASLWLATQDFGKVNEVYGKDIAATIFNNCSTHVCFRVNDPDTAEFLERSFGEREVSIVDDTVSMGLDDRKAGLSFARKTKMEKIVLAGELTGLRDLHFYLKMGHYSATTTSIKYRDYPVKNEIFMIRHDLSLSYIKKINKEIKGNPWERPIFK